MKKILIFAILLPFFSFALTANAVFTNSAGNIVSPPSVSASGISSCDLSSYSDIISCALYILNSLIPVIIALIIVWVIWSAFQFARAEGEERNKHRDAILWGIVALFVTVTIYALVAVLTNTFFSGTPSNDIKVVNVNSSITQ